MTTTIRKSLCFTMTDEEYEYIKAWFKHLYQWTDLLERSGYVGYNSMNIEKMRVTTYAALLMLADGCYATAEEIASAADIGIGSMEDVLTGLTYMREVEAEMFDDGEIGYKLTSFGQAWASTLVAECE